MKHGGRATGLWRWDVVRPEHYAVSGLEVNRVVEGGTGELLLATVDGLKRFADGKIADYVIPGVTGHFRPTVFFRGSDGNLWIGTQQGLLRWHDGRADVFGVAEGLSGPSVTGFREDREGDVWVATSEGIDRFRRYAIARVSASEGLSTSNTTSVQATAEGAIWIGSTNGLNRWQDGKVTVYGRQAAPGLIGKTTAEESGRPLPGNPRGLGLDDQGRLLAATRQGIFRFEGDRLVAIPRARGGNIWSIAGDGAGKLWAVNGTLGLLHFKPGEEVEPIPWSHFGQRENAFGAFAMLPDRQERGLWVGFWDGGIAYYKDGQVRASYKVADGLGNGIVSDLRFGRSGEVWVATGGGLSRVKDGRIATLTSKNGLPCDAVHWTIEDADHSTWLFTPCGLLRVARSEMDAWVSDSSHKLQPTVFDAFDGIRTLGAYGGYGPRVAKAADGKIWFLTYDGISVIDPKNLAFNNVKPPVYVEQITADGKKYEATSGLKLPPLVRDLTIDYTALSLAVPEKVHFRYKLEGQDADWKEVINKRQVQYSNLGPKKYRFRVLACNNSGVWNEEGALLDFSIAPAFYQTNWFRALCVLAFLVLLWGLYQYRLHQIQREFNARLEGRIHERMRIARELHDTLLQSFHGLMFQFQAARNLLPEQTENEKGLRAIDEAMTTTELAIAEGRDAIRDLRPEGAGERDLGELLTAAGQELALVNWGSHNVAAFRVIVEGEQQKLSPMLQDEVYRIGREVIRNAFRHADAQRIEVEIRYDAQRLRLRVRDDGKGIDAKVLKNSGRTGHWGLPGIRERAGRIGAKLDFWSEVGAGTEVEVTVPAKIAYAAEDVGPRFRLFRKAGSDERRF